MLEVKNVSVHYGRAIALASVDLYVKEGEFVAVIGPNGAGKTTLLRAISGLIELEKGTITYDGKVLVESSKSQFRKIGKTKSLKPNQIVEAGIIHCPERRRLFHTLSVEENLRLGAHTYQHDKEDIEKQLEEVLTLFPVLRDRFNEEAGNFSGGQQQMIAIARSLMGRPKILILDEPSLGLAPIVRNEIIDKIKEVQQKGTTVMIVEQDAKLALNVAERVYLLEDGAIERSGTCAEFFKDNYILESYLGLN